MKAPEPFDVEQVYDREIAPLMTQIIAICQREKIPMLASFCYQHSADNTQQLCTTSLHRDGWQPPEFFHARRLIREGFTSFAITHR